MVFFYVTLYAFLQDGWACWPDTPAGQSAQASCPEFKIGFDPLRK